MSLSPGAKLGPYEILAPIGAGGMGEVYGARDPRLNREVAIKVSAERFAERFEREARAVAALNHPNICSLYDVGPNYLVMELIDGPTLADRIKEGAIPLEEALGIARQIADALEAAHEKGITHRDLKPGNIKVRPDGMVKVLDFGLAKMGGTPTAKSEDSPTISMHATQAGMILGTAAYMAPEQARGKPVDKRADIWAFGVLLYEMLTGKRLFQGDDVTDTLASVLRQEPDWESVPVQARRLLQRCLEKDPKKRLRDIGDAMPLMDEAPVTSGAQLLPARSRPWPWIAAAAALLLTTLGFGYVAFQHTSEEPTRVVKLSAQPPEKSTYASSGPPAVSPDGRHVAFASVVDGKALVWVHDLDSLTSRPLTDTEGGTYPFWSPDSRFIGFFTANSLKKIELAGGPAVTICGGIVLGRGGSWNANGVIVFAPNLTGGLFRVSAAGGMATPLTTPDKSLKETVHWYPWFLPDGRHFLYTATTREDSELTAIYVADVDAKDESRSRRKLLNANSQGVYTPVLGSPPGRSQSEGYLLFLREQTLMAQPFDASKAQTTGDAVPIAEQVDHATGSTNGRFGTSDNGVLAYYTGANVSVKQLTWLDRSGKVTGTLGEPGNVTLPSISPDGRAVALSRLDPKTGMVDIWIRDLARGTDSRFTFGPRNNFSSIWSPDGKAIAYVSNRDGTPRLYQKATSGTGQDQALDQDHGAPTDRSRDGRYILQGVVGPVVQLGAKGGGDIWVLPLFGDRKAFPYLQTEFGEYDGKFSPNGRWLAYTSNETTRPEVYVVSFPTPGGKWQVSTTGGSAPVWSRDGKELYFRALDGKVMAASVGNDAAKFEAGVPKQLFSSRIGARGNQYFDVSREGKFLLAVSGGSDAPTPPINVVLNWQAGLKR